jgi:hypothetical protein
MQPWDSGHYFSLNLIDSTLLSVETLVKKVGKQEIEKGQEKDHKFGSRNHVESEQCGSVVMT